MSTKKRGPKPGPSKFLTDPERLLILCLLAHHEDRAQAGVDSMNSALASNPTNAAIQGMAARFATLVSLIGDIKAGLRGKQDWRPTYVRLLAELEAEPCQPAS